MNYNKVIGIDPGIGGGIAVYTKNGLVTAKMPSYSVMRSNGKKKNETDIKKLSEIFQEQKKDYNPIVFIELVQAWTGTDDPARQYQISRMLANYEALKTTITLTGIDFIQVMPQEWQGFLNLKVKGESKKDRKQRYVRFAASKYPEAKATLWSSDAICLVEFGRRKLSFDKEWIAKKLPRRNDKLAF